MSKSTAAATDQQVQAGQDGAESLQETVEDLVERVSRLEDENKKLKTENETLRNRVDDLEGTQDLATNTLWDLEDFILGRFSLSHGNIDEDYDILSRIEDVRENTSTSGDIQTIKEDVADARERYHEQAAMLQKRFTALEDELDIDTMALATNDDQIARFVKNGADDVDGISRVNKKDRRARKMLRDADDCGQRINDSEGQRVVFKSSQVKPYLKGQEGRSFASSEVKRIFEVVEQVGKTSTRRVELEKNQEDQHRLAVWGL